MATLTIPEQTLARLRAAAAAQRVSLDEYLDRVAAMETHQLQATLPSAAFGKSSIAERIAAADSIRKLASELKEKATIEELIADQHAGHKY